MKLYDRLIKIKDDTYRDFQIKLVPNIPPETIIGVRTPEMRKIAKEVFESEDRDTFLNDLPHRYYEENLIHFFVLSMIRDFDQCVQSVEQFLPYVDCWPVSDQATPKAFKKNSLTVEESRKLLESIDTSSVAGKRNIAMIALMMICGLRTIEVSRANVGSISNRGNVKVLYVQGKGRNDDSDFVRIPKLVETLINDYLSTRSELKADDPLFVATSNRSINKRLSTVSISTIAKTAMTNAGIIGEKYTAHSLRHTAATNAIRAGASLEEVSQMLRHKSLNMTMIYNHAIKAEENRSENLVAEAIEKSVADDRAGRTSKKSKSKKHRGSSARNNENANTSKKSRRKKIDDDRAIDVKSLISALKAGGCRLI